MNKREAAVIGAYTGILMGAFSDLHAYIEEVMGGPIFTHQMADTELMKEVKLKAKPEFLTICEDITE